MRIINAFGYQLNGLEFVTYIIIPAAMVITVLLYIFFNLRELRISIDKDENILIGIDDNIKNNVNRLKEKEVKSRKLIYKLLQK